MCDFFKSGNDYFKVITFTTESSVSIHIYQVLKENIGQSYGQPGNMGGGKRA